ncbi:hypothetical protein GEMRC1_006193 [Eukaryota sp. GEM-RC1]
MYEEIETHLNSDGTEKRCDQPFSLVKSHVCREVSDFDTKQTSTCTHIEPDKVGFLVGHEMTVLSAKWCPSAKRPYILSCSSDGTARLWPIDVRQDILQCAKEGSEKMVICKHNMDEQVRDVTCISWSSSGLIFASACSGGIIRLLDISSDIPKYKHELKGHQNAIMSISFNKKGDLLASASSDQSVIVWDTANGQIQQIFAFHCKPVLDVQWRTNESFASASMDGTIAFCKLGEEQPKQIFRHNGDINQIVWDSAGVHLASASDDYSAKIWTVLSDHPLHSLTHPMNVFAVQWRPEPKGQPGRILATLAEDMTLRIWDAERGKCLHLFKFNDSIYNMSFSPDGVYVAVGSSDTLFIYETLSGDLNRKFHVGTDIGEINWSPDWTGKQIVTFCLPQQLQIAIAEPFS